MNKAISHPPKKSRKLNTLQRLTESSLDVQFQLCNSFLRHTSDQLFQRQIQVMMESSLLIDTLSKKYQQPQKQNKIYLDNQSTQGSRILDITLLQQLQPKKQKLFTRKNSNRSECGTNLSFTQILREVQNNCSRKIYTAINNLINDKKRLEKRVSQIQNIDNTTKKKIDVYQKYQEFALGLQTKNKKLQKQIKQLKQRNKDLQIKSLKKNNIVQSVPKITTIKILNDVKKMFEERQNILDRKQNFVGQIEKNIIKAIDQNLIQKGCQKCCSLLKKIKTSLLNYKYELQRQDTQLVKITNLYKHRLIEQLS